MIIFQSLEVFGGGLNRIDGNKNVQHPIYLVWFQVRFQSWVEFQPRVETCYRNKTHCKLTKLLVSNPDLKPKFFWFRLIPEQINWVNLGYLAGKVYEQDSIIPDYFIPPCYYLSHTQQLTMFCCIYPLCLLAYFSSYCFSSALHE